MMGISNVPAIRYEVEGLERGVSPKWIDPASSLFATGGLSSMGEQMILFSGIGEELQAIPMTTQPSARYANDFPCAKRWDACEF
ncbi:hypothetical protein AB0D67_35420 [Streptosporangium sp. NPDC048047]|uniref:hypothetical protein n=1 Tax=Streptosporangium sp. NPDC048047 TaxID=3155748 RepID=UPI00341733B6